MADDACEGNVTLGRAPDLRVENVLVAGIAENGEDRLAEHRQAVRTDHEPDGTPLERSDDGVFADFFEHVLRQVVDGIDGESIGEEAIVAERQLLGSDDHNLETAGSQRVDECALFSKGSTASSVTHVRPRESARGPRERAHSETRM